MPSNRHLSALGSGRVRLKSYTGHLSSSGSINVKVGDKSISSERPTTTSTTIDRYS